MHMQVSPASRQATNSHGDAHLYEPPQRGNIGIDDKNNIHVKNQRARRFTFLERYIFSRGPAEPGPYVQPHVRWSSAPRGGLARSIYNVPSRYRTGSIASVIQSRVRTYTRPGGITCSRARGHNASALARKDLRAGKIQCPRAARNLYWRCQIFAARHSSSERRVVHHLAWPFLAELWGDL